MKSHKVQNLNHMKMSKQFGMKNPRANHNTKECYFSKYCQICDMTNHITDDCYFNKWCEICGHVIHNTDECYYSESSKPQKKVNSKESVSFDNDEDFYNSWTPRNMRMIDSS